MTDDPAREGWLDAAVAAEFPALRLWWLALEARATRSPPALRRRMRALSDRWHGATALGLRTKPIPHAYRVFYRHIGLDPDVDRVPVEAMAVERLKAGGFRSRSTLEDAALIALMDTGVPVWALDGDTLDGPLGLRAAAERERLGRRDERAPYLPEGRLVVADAAGPIAVLFGELAPGHAVGPETRRTVVFSIQVSGVPAIHVSEALWTVSDIVETVAAEA